MVGWLRRELTVDTNWSIVIMVDVAVPMTGADEKNVGPVIIVDP